MNESRTTHDQTNGYRMSSQKKVSLFLFLTFAFSLFSYVPIIRAGTLGVNGGLFVLTMMWSPGLAALLTQFIATRSLRGLGWRIGSVRWLGIAYILPVVYALPVYAFTWLTRLGRFPNPSRIASLTEKYASTNVMSTLATFLLFSLTVDMVGPLITALGEEIGWRGLFVPELAKMTSFTKTALISGDVVEAVRAMKREGNGPMSTIGSLTLCRSLLKAGLVDRFRVVVFPVITGSTGYDRIYDGYPDVALDLVASQTFDGRLQLLEYVPTVLAGPPGEHPGS